MFITFEGLDGGGKTTQSSLLASFLALLGFSVFSTREPGGTLLAERLRGIILDDKSLVVDGIVELMLYNAARYDHYVRAIRPLLQAGYIVICDRFLDSTIAYQGYARGVDLSIIFGIHRLIFGDLQPDLTFVIDIDIEKCLARATGRYEAEGFAFLQRVKEGFLRIVEDRKASGNVELIDGNMSIYEIFAKISGIVTARIKLVDLHPMSDGDLCQ